MYLIYTLVLKLYSKVTVTICQYINKYKTTDRIALDGESVDIYALRWPSLPRAVCGRLTVNPVLSYLYNIIL